MAKTTDDGAFVPKPAGQGQGPPRVPPVATGTLEPPDDRGSKEFMLPERRFPLKICFYVGFLALMALIIIFA